jgi:hypothetical protein
MFGRKGLGSPQPSAPQDGYAWVDRHLSRYEQPGSMGFAQSLGQGLFDSSYHAMKNERGVQIEAIVAMLSSVGGHLCLVAVLDALRDEGRTPTDIGMLVVSGVDGHNYYYGDAPNRLLCEASESFVSLVFGAAHAHGARVSIEMVHQEMKLLASRSGSPQFLALDLPAGISLDSPLNWARQFTPFVIETLGMAAPPFMIPRILGFAVQQAIDVGHQSLDPTVLAQIAMGCSMRAAKLDPDWVHAGH